MVTKNWVLDLLQNKENVFLQDTLQVVSEVKAVWITFKFTLDIDIGFLVVKSILLFQKDKAILVISI